MISPNLIPAFPSVNRLGAGIIAGSAGLAAFDDPPGFDYCRQAMRSYRGPKAEVIDIPATAAFRVTETWTSKVPGAGEQGDQHAKSFVNVFEKDRWGDI